MDAARRRRWIQLGALLVGLAIAVQFVLLPALGPTAPSSGPTRPSGRGGGRNTTAAVRPVEVRLDALSRAASLAGETPNAALRNPFRMGPAQPAPGSAGEQASAGSPKPATPVVPVPTAPAGPPPPPPIPYRFIGILSGAPGQGRIAVLSDGKTVVHGRVNQEIEGRYRIVHIGEESLQIEHIDGRGRQTLRLLGQ